MLSRGKDVNVEEWIGLIEALDRAVKEVQSLRPFNRPLDGFDLETIQIIAGKSAPILSSNPAEMATRAASLIKWLDVPHMDSQNDYSHTIAGMAVYRLKDVLTKIESVAIAEAQQQENEVLHTLQSDDLESIRKQLDRNGKTLNKVLDSLAKLEGENSDWANVKAGIQVGLSGPALNYQAIVTLIKLARAHLKYTGKKSLNWLMGLLDLAASKLRSLTTDAKISINLQIAGSLSAITLSTEAIVNKLFRIQQSIKDKQKISPRNGELKRGKNLSEFTTENQNILDQNSKKTEVLWHEDEIKFLNDLKFHRVNLHVSIEEISQQLNLSIDWIEKLESPEIITLPVGYAVPWLKSYCRVLGLDPKGIPWELIQRLKSRA